MDNANNMSTGYLRGYMLRYKNKEGKRPRIIDQKKLYEYGHRYSTMKLQLQMKIMQTHNDQNGNDYSIKGITYNMDNMDKLLTFSEKLKRELPTTTVFENNQNINELQSIPIEDLNYTIQLVNLDNPSESNRTHFDAFLKKVANKLEYKDLMFSGEIKLEDFYKSSNPWTESGGEYDIRMLQMIYFNSILTEEDMGEEQTYIFDIENFIKTEILKSKKKELDILAGFRPSEKIFNEYKEDFIKILSKYNEGNEERLAIRWSDDDIIARFKSITTVQQLDAILKEKSSDNFNIFLKDMFTLAFEEFYGFIFDPYDSYEIDVDNCKVKQDDLLYGEHKYSVTHAMRIAYPTGGTDISHQGVVNLTKDFGYQKLSSKKKNTSVNNQQGQQDVQGTGQVNVQGTGVTNERTTNDRSLRAEGNLDFTVGSVSDERSFWWPSDMSLMTFNTDKKYYTYIPTKMPTNQPPSEPPPELPPGPQPGPQPEPLPTPPPKQHTGNSPEYEECKRKIHKAGDMIEILKESISKQQQRFSNINNVKYGGDQETKLNFSNVEHGVDLNYLYDLLKVYREKLLKVKEEDIRKLDAQLEHLIEKAIPKQEKKLRQYGSKINQVIWDLFEDKKDPRENETNFSDDYNKVNDYMQKLEYEYIKIEDDNTIVIEKQPYEWDHTLYEIPANRLRINQNNKKIVGDIEYKMSEETLCDINPKFKLLRKCFKPIEGSSIWKEGIQAENLTAKKICYNQELKITGLNFDRFRSEPKMKIIVDDDLIFTENQSSSTAKCANGEIATIFPFDYSQTHSENNDSDAKKIKPYLEQNLTINQFGKEYSIDGYYMHTDLFLKTIGVISYKNNKKNTKTELKDLRQNILDQFEKYGWEYVAPDALRIESSSIYQDDDEDEDEEPDELWEHYGKSDIFFY